MKLGFINQASDEYLLGVYVYAITLNSILLATFISFLLLVLWKIKHFQDASQKWAMGAYTLVLSINLMFTILDVIEADVKFKELQTIFHIV